MNPNIVFDQSFNVASTKIMTRTDRQVYYTYLFEFSNWLHSLSRIFVLFEYIRHCKKFQRLSCVQNKLLLYQTQDMIMSQTTYLQFDRVVIQKKQNSSKLVHLPLAKQFFVYILESESELNSGTRSWQQQHVCGRRYDRSPNQLTFLDSVAAAADATKSQSVCHTTSLMMLPDICSKIRRLRCSKRSGNQCVFMERGRRRSISQV